MILGSILDTDHPAPIYRITVAGKDITASLAGRLISLTLTDNRGLDADQLDLVLDDHDGLLEIPPHGARLRVAIGWAATGLVDKGEYTVDETVHSGAPDQLTIRARSTDLRDGFGRKRTRSWHATTVGAIVASIAVEYGLTARVAPALAGLSVTHLDQTNESDLNLLTRLGKQHDALAAVKAGNLLFMPVGGSITASGLPLPHVLLTRADGDQHSYQVADRDSYSGVIAQYHDLDKASTEKAIVGSEENAKTLRHTYASQENALRAARAEWKRLQRGSATLTYTLAIGRPDLLPEQTFTVSGIKDEIGAIVWLGSKVTHNLTDSGYTNSLEMQSKLPDDADSVSNAELPQAYTGVKAKYRDEKTGKQLEVTEGKGDAWKVLTHLYASKGTAERAVKREWKRLQIRQGSTTA